MINGAQIRAARALLDWTSRDLSTRAGMQPHTVTNFEGGKVKTEAETIEKMVRTLESAGIEFTATGVQLKTPIYRFEGENWFIELLRDIQKSGETDIIIENVVPQKSPQAVIDELMVLRSSNVNFRMTAEEGNTYLDFPVSCYRWVPKQYFKNWITVIYGDCVAVKTTGKIVGCTVIRDKEISETMRNKFNLVWDLLKPIEIESTAHVHIP
jgi:transcriptional regulator with XRE-family HTH domain